jgi:DinB superfamily
MNARETIKNQAERGRALAQNLTDDQLNARPDTETWSLGMQLDHITVVLEKATAQMDDTLAKGVPPGDPAAWKPSFLERKFIQMVGAQPGGRTNPVPRGFEPSEARLERAALLARYAAAHEKLLSVIERTQSADLKRIKVASAAVPWLKLSLGAWFEAMAVHTDYHLAKAERLHPRA